MWLFVCEGSLSGALRGMPLGSPDSGTNGCSHGRANGAAYAKVPVLRRPRSRGVQGPQCDVRMHWSSAHRLPRLLQCMHDGSNGQPNAFAHNVAVCTADRSTI